MRSNRKLLFGIALILATLVFVQIWLVLRNSSNSTATNTAANAGNAALVPVSAPSGRRAAVALQDIPVGSIITKGMFELKQLPQALNSEGYINSDQEVVGYITRVPLRRGDRMVPEDLVGHISDVGIAGALRPGYRAMMVPITNKPTLHDLVKIGNYVDILGAFEGQESRNIVENVRVMAVDVLGTDFPPTNIAMRGPFKATAKGSTIPEPGVDPSATPTPTPAPQNPAPPTAAITIEVTPTQANAFLLTQAAGATYDFVLRPATPGIAITPPGAEGAEAGTPAVNVSVTRPQLAPYSTRIKQSGTPRDRNVMREARAALKDFRVGAEALTGRGGVGPSFPVPTGDPATPFVPPTTSIPAAPTPPPPPATYDIPIYADGKMVRVDTVRNPSAGGPGQ